MNSVEQNFSVIISNAAHSLMWPERDLRNYELWIILCLWNILSYSICSKKLNIWRRTTDYKLDQIRSIFSWITCEFPLWTLRVYISEHPQQLKTTLKIQNYFFFNHLLIILAWGILSSNCISPKSFARKKRNPDQNLFNQWVV